MARKAKFSEKDIVETAFKIVRAQGMAALSTRSIAAALSSSTMPIYSFMKSRTNLTDRLMLKIFDTLMSYQTTPRTGDIFLDMGVGYVRFARDEAHLFRAITDPARVEAFRQYQETHAEALLSHLDDYPAVTGLPEEAIREFFTQGWTYAHGLACLVNIGYFPDMDDTEICRRLTYTGDRYVGGFQALAGQKEIAQ